MQEILTSRGLSDEARRPLLNEVLRVAREESNSSPAVKKYHQDVGTVLDRSGSDVSEVDDVRCVDPAR